MIFSLVQLVEAMLWQWGEIQPSLLVVSGKPIPLHERQTECIEANRIITGYVLPAILVFEITSQVTNHAILHVLV